MLDQNGKVSFTAVCLMALLACILFQDKVFTALYRVGVWQHYSVADVETHLKRGSPNVSVQCEAGELGWDFACDYLERRYDGTFVRARYGVMSTYYGPVAYCDRLPADAPSAFKVRPRGCPTPT